MQALRADYSLFISQLIFLGVCLSLLSASIVSLDYTQAQTKTCPAAWPQATKTPLAAERWDLAAFKGDTHVRWVGDELFSP